MVEALATIVVIVLMFVPYLNMLVGVVAGGFLGGLGGAVAGFLLALFITGVARDVQ